MKAAKHFVGYVSVQTKGVIAGYFERARRGFASHAAAAEYARREAAAARCYDYKPKDVLSHRPYVVAYTVNFRAQCYDVPVGMRIVGARLDPTPFEARRIYDGVGLIDALAGAVISTSAEESFYAYMMTS